MTYKLSYLATGAANQTTISVTAFLCSVSLAIYLPVAEYGVYAIALSFAIFLSAITNALITTPLIVEIQINNNVSSRRQTRAIKLSLTKSTVIYSTIILAASTAAALMEHSITKLDIAAFLSYSISYSLREFASKLATTTCNPNKILGYNLVHLVLTAISLLLVAIATSKSAFYALALLFLGNIITFLLIGRLIWGHLKTRNSSEIESIYDSGLSAKTIGIPQRIWALTGAILVWMQTQGFVPLATLLFNTETAATLSASRLILTPALTVFSGVSQFILPKLAAGDPNYSGNSLNKVYNLLSTGAILYWFIAISVIWNSSNFIDLSKFHDFHIFAALWALVAITQPFRDRSSLRHVAVGNFRLITIATIYAQPPLILGIGAASLAHNPSYLILGVVVTELALGYLLRRMGKER